MAIFAKAKKNEIKARSLFSFVMTSSYFFAASSGSKSTGIGLIFIDGI
jgi:hypothetical protein